jgi:hypothetical protein
MREEIGRSRINTERSKNDRRERREIQEDLKEIWKYSEKKWGLGENRKI